MDGPAGWAHGAAEDLELHDVQFMLCELQKFFHRDNRHNHLRQYAGPHPLTSAAPPLLGQSWLETLEEAVLLFSHPRDLANCTLEKLIKDIAYWLSLRVDGHIHDGGDGNAQGRVLHHGDAVCFTHCHSGAREQVLLCLPGGASRMRAVSAGTFPDPKSKLDAGAVFVVERRDGVGAVRFGEEVFFRAQGGAHVGLAAQTRAGVYLAAPQKCERYGAKHVFRLERMGVDDTRSVGESVGCGAKVQISRSSGQHRSDTLEVSGMACILVSDGAGVDSMLRSSSSHACRELRIDLHVEPADVLHQLREALQHALDQGLSIGTLLREGAGGGIATATAEAVRQRLLGTLV